MKAKAYRNYLLGVLLVILAANYMDGLVLGLVLQDIKTDLDLTDTQLGFLSGLAFAFFYSIAGVPLARWADRGNRVTIISLTTAAWSLMVALCGVAANFTQLVLMRVGVAVGEAGCIPPAHSLIADYFGRAERSRAVARYMLGGPVSVIIGYFAAGWLNEFFGWRTTFMILGVPGIGVAALAWFTLKEPRCAKPAAPASNRPEATAMTPPEAGAAGLSPPDAGAVAISLPDVGAGQRSSPEAAVASSAQPSVREVCSALWANKTFRHVLYGFSVMYFFSSGITQWQPAFFMRSYGVTSGELGTWFAAIYGVGGVFGLYLGGEWAARRAAHNEALQLKVMALAYGVYAVLSTFIYLAPNRYWAFGLMALGAVLSAMTSGPLFALIQTLVAPRMRALSISIVYLFANLIGLGLGPLATGALSDALRPLLGEESLRYALLMLCPGYLWLAWHMRRAGQTVTRDLASCPVDEERVAQALPAPGRSLEGDTCPDRAI